jgi:plastocyanin
MKKFFLTALVAVGLAACAGAPPPKTERTIDLPPTSQPTTPPVTAPEPPKVVQPPVTDVAPAPDIDQPVAVTPPTESKPSVSDNAVKKNKPVRAAATATPVTPAKTPSPIVDTRPATSSSEGSALKGHIDLVVGPDQSVASGEVADAVVYFMPTVAGAHVKPGHFQIYTRDKHFDPASLVVPVGSTVSFPNQDEIIHNVFSASLGAEFDLGFYGEGGTASQVFKKPGLVLINCNVHQSMQASILVVDTPYYVHPTKTGDFVINDVPNGVGKLVIWHPRATSIERAISMPASDSSWTITISKPRVTGHLNKEHKTYKLDVTQK